MQRQANHHPDNVPAATHGVQNLNAQLLHQEVVLHGYLGTRSDMSKKMSFVHLLDPSLRYSVQIISLRTDETSAMHDALKRLNERTPVCVRGRLKSRKPAANPAKDGVERINDVELELLHLCPLNSFPNDLAALMTNDALPPEQRHLSIRSDAALREALTFRSRAAAVARATLAAQAFQEVETPILFKSTPEGAREFLVPTRTPNMAYALPQSPQQYKQILMASGIPRYYQMARCFRDEDLRADRQPEFTQLDLEMAFANGDNVMTCIEAVVRSLWQELLHLPLTTPLPRVTYEEAMSKYGSDKPDRRIGMEILSIGHMLPVDLISKIGPLTDPAVDVLKLHVSDRPAEARNFVAALMESKEAADAGILTNPAGQPGIFIFDSSKPLNGLQAFGFEAAEQLEERLQLTDGDVVVIQAREKRPFSGGSTALGRLRLGLHREAVARGLAEAPAGFDIFWVTQFPMFTPSNGEDPGQGGTAGLSATHHPFTAPASLQDAELLSSDPAAAKSEHYDLVVNGVELGGGSRRIHDAAFQEHVLREVLKMSDERLEDFRHLLDVLRAGCPPHAGIALGFDRLVAVMLGRTSIRDVIAFPKNSRGEDALVKSPARLTDAQLDVYHLRRAAEPETPCLEAAGHAST